MRVRRAADYAWFDFTARRGNVAPSMRLVFVRSLFEGMHAELGLRRIPGLVRPLPVLLVLLGHVRTACDSSRRRDLIRLGSSLLRELGVERVGVLQRVRVAVLIEAW